MPVMKKTKRSNRRGFLVVSAPDVPVRVESQIRPSRWFRWKPTVEWLLAAMLLLPGLPILALLVVLVRLNSRGPGIYRQSRLGKNGRPFIMYKIRTMCQDAESRSGPIWTKIRDPRITRLGRLLRKLHLDELPQLLNVVKGEMALIGPRPERPEIVAALVPDIPGYTNRLVVLPGVTGLAQINLPPDATLDDVRRKLVLDLEYVQTAGLLLDVRIFMSTFVRLLGLPGEVVMRWFRVKRPIPCIGPGGHAAAPSGAKDASTAAVPGGNGSSWPKPR
jgi:lipopolysaccharide/colanic/teichoic acid biosynthesis glycosyltransferase